MYMIDMLIVRDNTFAVLYGDVKKVTSENFMSNYEDLLLNISNGYVKFIVSSQYNCI